MTLAMQHRSYSQAPSVASGVRSGRGQGPRAANGPQQQQQSTRDPYPSYTAEPGEDGSPGRRAAPLKDGFTNHHQVRGPLDVRNRCWKCLKVARHKDHCPQPHPDYDPTKHFDLIRKLAHGNIVCPPA